MFLAALTGMGLRPASDCSDRERTPGACNITHCSLPTTPESEDWPFVFAVRIRERIEPGFYVLVSESEHWKVYGFSGAASLSIACQSYLGYFLTTRVELEAGRRGFAASIDMTLSLTERAHVRMGFDVVQRRFVASILLIPAL